MTDPRICTFQLDEKKFNLRWPLPKFVSMYQALFIFWDNILYFCTVFQRRQQKFGALFLLDLSFDVTY